jgi:hypothetical protein
MQRSKFLNSFLLGLLVLAIAGGARADDTYSFSIVPTGGAVSGTPGSTVGWGYSLTNNSTTDFLLTLGVSEDSVLDLLGTVDTTIFDLPIVAPLGTVSENYDPINPAGMFGLSQLFLDPGLTPGTTATGHFFIDAVFCDVTLTICSNTIETESAAVPVTATSPGGTPISEPSSILLLASGLCAIGVGICSRRKSQCGELSNG